MKRSRFTEEQIVRILKEATAGKKVVHVYRQYSISDVTFYTWRKKYGGLEVSELKILKQHESEIKKLKQLQPNQILAKKQIHHQIVNSLSGVGDFYPCFSVYQ